MAGLVPDARPLDRGKPRDVDTEGGNQPADKSLINRRLKLRSQLCAAPPFPADGHLTARPLDYVRALDGEHKSTSAYRRAGARMKMGAPVDLNLAALEKIAPAPQADRRDPMRGG